MNLAKNLFAICIALVASTGLTAQSNIADLRANYDVGDVVTVSGIIINGPELGSVRYLQDETGGIALYPGSNWSGQDAEPIIGDMVTITGEVTEFANLLEIGPNISSITIDSQGNDLPEPIVVTPEELTEQYEGMLMQINQATFFDGGAMFGSSTYGFSASDEDGVAYVRNGSPLIGELIPLGPINLVGVLSQYSNNSSTEGYQLLPRDYDDFIFSSPINFTSSIEQYNLTTTSFDLEWSTDLESTTEVEYGLTPDLGSFASAEGEGFDHYLTLEGLEPGYPYYCQVFSVAGEDTARSTVGVYSTVSESSGEIKVYFNRSVNTDFATEEEAVGLFGLTDDTLAAYIDRAQHTLDIAVYNLNSFTIVGALNDAAERGVDIRYVSEAQTSNTGFNSLDESITTFVRQGATSSGMHNKFMVVDRNVVDSAIVLTGSTNWTTNNLLLDPNNMVIIQDQALARAYTIEFEEMWGSSTMTPDPENARFGALKMNNTPEKFIIGGSNVELYFSPSDNTTNAIVEAIESANNNLDFALLVFTNDMLRDAVIDQTNIFLTPRGIIEQVGGSASDVPALIDAGVDIYSHADVDAQLHHKYAIIDHSNPSSDPIVVTGSHNWSASAESNNDENTLIIHDARVANLFLQEFMARLEETTLSVNDLDQMNFKMYPNPAQSQAHVQFSLESSKTILLQVFDLSGKRLSSDQFVAVSGENRREINTAQLANGAYVVAIQFDEQITFQKLIVKH